MRKLASTRLDGGGRDLSTTRERASLLGHYICVRWRDWLG